LLPYGRPLKKEKAMKGTISIDSERCKACGYCIDACPLQIIGWSQSLNSQGFAPVTLMNDEKKCTGCSLCFLVCPDVAIEVFRKEGEEKR